MAKFISLNFLLCFLLLTFCCIHFDRLCLKPGTLRCVKVLVHCNLIFKCWVKLHFIVSEIIKYW